MKTIFCKPETSMIIEANVIYVLITKSQGSTMWSDLTGKTRASQFPDEHPDFPATLMQGCPFPVILSMLPISQTLSRLLLTSLISAHTTNASFGCGIIL